MKYILLTTIIIVGIFGFIIKSVQISKRYHSSECVNQSDYTCAWIFAAMAILCALYLFISRW